MPPARRTERQTLKPRNVPPPNSRRSLALGPVSFRSTPRPEAGRPGLVEDHVELDAVRDPSLAAHLDALLGDRWYLGGLDHCGVGVQPIGPLPARCGRRGRAPHRYGGDRRDQ